MVLKNNKGNMQLIGSGVLVLTLAAIILVFGLMILDDLQGTVSNTLATVQNQTVASATNSSNTAAPTAGSCGLNGFSLTAVYNASGYQYTATSNYTVINTNLGTWRLVNQTTHAVNISYTYYYGAGEDCRVANKTIVGTGTFASYWELIVLAIVVAVVISLLLIVFASRRIQ